MPVFMPPARLKTQKDVENFFVHIDSSEDSVIYFLFILDIFGKALFLCHVVLGTLAALGHLPVDVLLGGLDVTRLAVDAAVNLVVSNGALEGQ